MTKTEALELLGGNCATAARAIGITVQAVWKWPDPLPPRLEDRVIAAKWRLDRDTRRELLARHISAHAPRKS